MDYQEKIGKRIKEERLKKGISQKELATRCNKSCSWLCKVETGVNGLPIDELLTIAEALGIEAISLYKEAGTETRLEIYTQQLKRSLAGEDASKTDLTPQEVRILAYANKLSQNGFNKLIERAQELIKLEGKE